MGRFMMLGLAAALLGGWTVAQDMGGGAPPQDKACDLAKTEPRDYCASCKVWPAADQVDKGACKKCQGKVEKVETCVKTYWNCATMHGGTPKRHAKSCCSSKTCCKETPSLALVGYVCESCKAKAAKEADVRHTGEKCAGPVKKTCAESTKFPHGGAEE